VSCNGIIQPMSDTIKSIIQSMKQISIETDHTYGKRRLKHHLNAKGHQIGIYAVASLMKKINIRAITPALIGFNISDITYPVSIALLLVKVTIKQIVCHSV
jgi:hypothetical protein